MQRQEPDLQGRAGRLRTALREMVRAAAEDGPVYAIGAPTRATTLVNWAGIAQYLACACEIAGSEKIGACIPGTSVPVVDEAKLIADRPPHALLLAWDLEDTIVPALRRKGYQGTILIPSRSRGCPVPDRSLMVMIPTRGRRKLAERCLKSYADTVSLETTEAVFVTDGDDRLTYEGMDSRPASMAVLEPRAVPVGPAEQDRLRPGERL